ncbi:xanthine permease [Acinetobacter sp. MD2(2019)]|nr:xanthine permease [Acinetobacter sp. MD2(2019)]
MKLTESGQIFFVCVALLMVWSFILTQRWVNRLIQNKKSDSVSHSTSQRKKIKAKTERPSKFEFAYLFAVVFSISAIFFPFSYWVTQAIYNLSTKPTYTGRIVSYTSEWVKTERTDSNNRSYTVDELRHTAQVTFTDKDHQIHTLDNSINSTAIPVVGDSITIVYAQGDQRVAEKSIRSFILYFAASFMLFILGFILIAIIAYGLNRDMTTYIARLKKFTTFH